jgi:hypothetical protein
MLLAILLFVVVGEMTIGFGGSDVSTLLVSVAWRSENEPDISSKGNHAKVERAKSLFM